jgi:hypothetical protein
MEQLPHELRVANVENGFLVTEYPHDRGLVGRMWVFETAQALSQFFLGWGEQHEKLTVD